jgi:hypothetical protein
MDDEYLSRIEHAAPFAGAAEGDLRALVAEVRRLREELDYTLAELEYARHRDA